MNSPNVNCILCMVLLAVSLPSLGQESAEQSNREVFELHNVEELLKHQSENGRPWLQFLDRENLMTGLYVLKAGSEDRQGPHENDEVYYILEGEGKFVVNDQEPKMVKAGDVLYVASKATHRFVEIVQDLKLLVFFEK